MDLPVLGGSQHGITECATFCVWLLSLSNMFSGSSTLWPSHLSTATVALWVWATHCSTLGCCFHGHDVHVSCMKEWGGGALEGLQQVLASLTLPTALSREHGSWGSKHWTTVGAVLGVISLSVSVDILLPRPSLHGVSRAPWLEACCPATWAA